MHFCTMPVTDTHYEFKKKKTVQQNTPQLPPHLLTWELVDRSISLPVRSPSSLFVHPSGGSNVLYDSNNEMDVVVFLSAAL